MVGDGYVVDAALVGFFGYVLYFDWVAFGVHEGDVFWVEFASLDLVVEVFDWYKPVILGVWGWNMLRLGLNVTRNI